MRVAGGLDGVSSLRLSLCCSQWLKELHGEKIASSSVQNRFKISSKSVQISNRFRTDFEPISNRFRTEQPISNRFRTDFEPKSNRIRTEIEPNLNRFRTDFEPKSNRFRTEPEPMSKRGGGLVANFPGTTCTALWGPAQVGWLMSSGTGAANVGAPKLAGHTVVARRWGVGCAPPLGAIPVHLSGKGLRLYSDVLFGVKCPKRRKHCLAG